MISQDQKPVLLRYPSCLSVPCASPALPPLVSVLNVVSLTLHLQRSSFDSHSCLTLEHTGRHRWCGLWSVT